MSEFKTAPDKQVSGEWESESECHLVVSVSDSLRTHALYSHALYRIMEFSRPEYWSG